MAWKRSSHNSSSISQSIDCISNLNSMFVKRRRKTLRIIGVYVSPAGWSMGFFVGGDCKVGDGVRLRDVNRVSSMLWRCKEGLMSRYLRIVKEEFIVTSNDLMESNIDFLIGLALRRHCHTGYLSLEFSWSLAAAFKKDLTNTEIACLFVCFCRWHLDMACAIQWTWSVENDIPNIFQTVTNLVLANSSSSRGIGLRQTK